MQKITRKLAIELMCHQCCGMYSDGRTDCECVRCPLYTFMPYRKAEPDESIFEYNPRRVGLVSHTECGKELTDEQRKEQGERLRKARGLK